MPLFTAIAGWVYALKPTGKKHFINFTLKKVYRLLIPMITIGTIYFFIQYIIPGTNNKGDLNDIWRIYLFPYTIYWYLPSLFIMFIMVSIIDINHWASKFPNWIYCIIIIYILMFIQQHFIPDAFPNIFSFKGALLLFPYFIIGVGVQRFSVQLFSSKHTYIFFLFASIGIILRLLEWFYPLQEYLLYQSLQPLWIISLLILLLHQKWSNPYLVWIGAFAYSIYLLHGFGTSGGRIILSYIGIQNHSCVFIFSTTLALLGPILADQILSKWEVTRFIFLGKN